MTSARKTDVTLPKPPNGFTPPRKQASTVISRYDSPWPTRTELKRASMMMPAIRAHGAGEHVDQYQHALGVDAGIARRLDVGADHVGAEAEPPARHQHVPDHESGDQDEQRDRNAEQRSVAERLNEIGKARNIAAARQKLAEAAHEDHHRERDQDRMGAGERDDRAHDEAGRRAHAQRSQRADHERPSARRPSRHRREAPRQASARRCWR